MSFRVIVEELQKDAPPLRMLSLTAPTWVQAIDCATEVLAREDGYDDEDDDE